MGALPEGLRQNLEPVQETTDAAKDKLLAESIQQEFKKQFEELVKNHRAVDRSAVTQKTWDEILNEFSRPAVATGSFNPEVFHENLIGVNAIFDGKTIRKIGQDIINQKHSLDKRKASGHLLKAQLEMLMHAAESKVQNELQKKMLEPQGLSYQLATLHMSLHKVLTELANLEQTTQESIDSLATTEKGPSSKVITTDASNNYYDTPSPTRTFADTLKSWSTRLKNYITPPTEATKNIQATKASAEKTAPTKPQARTSPWKLAFAGVLGLFTGSDSSHTSAETPSAPTTITTPSVTPTHSADSSQSDMTFGIAATGSVRAGLDNAHKMNASVQRGLENALDGVDGDTLLHSLYPNLTISPEVHTYLADTIGDRIQSAIGQRRSAHTLTGFHTHSNNETVSVGVLGRTENGHHVFEISMPDRHNHTQTTKVEITIPTQDQAERYAAVHSSHVIQRQAQESALAIEATDREGALRESNINIAFDRDASQSSSTQPLAAPIESREHTAAPQPLTTYQTAQIARKLNAAVPNHNEISFAALEDTTSPALSLTVTSGTNSLTIPFEHLEIVRGAIHCISSDGTLPLADAINNALMRTNARAYAARLGMEVHSATPAIITNQQQSAPRTIIDSVPHQELEKLAASDARKAAIDDRVLAMQNAAREKMRAYYQARETEARTRQREQMARITDTHRSSI